MRIETQEWIHQTAHVLINEMLELTDRAILTPEEEAWRERADNWVSYVGQHYKSDEVRE